MRRSDITPEQAYVKLADICAATEISEADAYRYLLRWRIAPEDADAIVSRLVEQEFIDTVRFANVYARHCLWNLRWGVRKVRGAMRQQRIPDMLIDKVLEEEMDYDKYIQILASALRTKARAMSSPLIYADKMKLARFALGRGYEPDLVQEMISDESSWRDEPAD